MRIRATLRLRNEHMLAARKTLSLSQSRAAAFCFMPLKNYRDLELFQYDHPKVAVFARNVADLLGIPVEQVLPSELAGTSIESTVTRFTDMEPGQLSALSCQAQKALPAPDAEMDAEEIKIAISRVLDTLTFREREIVKLRYGIGGGYTYTLEEVGKRFKVTQERVRQIEMRAIRRIKQSVWRVKELDGVK